VEHRDIQHFNSVNGQHVPLNIAEKFGVAGYSVKVFGNIRGMAVRCPIGGSFSFGVLFVLVGTLFLKSGHIVGIAFRPIRPALLYMILLFVMKPRDEIVKRIANKVYRLLHQGRMIGNIFFSALFFFGLAVVPH